MKEDGSERVDSTAPCPFCGSAHVELVDFEGLVLGQLASPGGYAVYCSDCTAEGPKAKTGSEARRAWNKRALVFVPARKNKPKSQ